MWGQDTAYEQAMLDLAPFRRARWIVLHLGGEADFVRKLLDFDPPEPHTGTIRATASA
jgi:hypothetical protein